MFNKCIFCILIILIPMLFPITASAGDWKFYIFGVDLDLIKERDWAMVLLGATSSILTHRAGHAGYLSLRGKHYEIVKERFHTPAGYITHEALNLDESRRYARAGFALQSIIGLGLTGFKATRKSSFTKGFVVATGLELALYHQYHEDWGDFGMIEDQGGITRV